MFSKSTPEETDKQIRELEIRLETLRRHVNKLYSDLDISPEQLDAAFQKSENFSPDEWKEVLVLKKEIEARFTAAEKGVVNPRSTSRTRKDLGELQRHWIFVR